MRKILNFIAITLFTTANVVAQSTDDDLYFIPKKLTEKERLEIQIKENKAKQEIIKNQKDLDEIDRYNRRYRKNSSHSNELYDGEFIVGDVRETDPDYDDIVRIVKFRNPRFAISIGSPLYNDFRFYANSWDWNVYYDGFNIYPFPTFSNPLWWDWKFNNFSWNWDYGWRTSYYGYSWADNYYWDRYDRWRYGWRNPYYYGYGGYYGRYYDRYYDRYYSYSPSYYRNDYYNRYVEDGNRRARVAESNRYYNNRSRSETRTYVDNNRSYERSNNRNYDNSYDRRYENRNYDSVRESNRTSTRYEDRGSSYGTSTRSSGRIEGGSSSRSNGGGGYSRVENTRR